jgi:hypothetical protein
MDARELGLTVAGIGLIVVIIGLLIAAGGLCWFGHLPGDISVTGRSVRVYAPVVSMLLISVVLSLILAVIRRLR